MNEFTVFTDKELLARILWGEARGEGTLGMDAVAWVIRNRKEDRSRRWPTTYRGVILQPRQFSAFNKGDPNREKMLNIWRLRKGKNLRAWGDAQNIAFAHINKNCVNTDQTRAANHYADISIPDPYWAKGKTPTVTIGKLRFWKI